MIFILTSMLALDDFFIVLTFTQYKYCFSCMYPLHLLCQSAKGWGVAIHMAAFFACMLVMASCSLVSPWRWSPSCGGGGGGGANSYHGGSRITWWRISRPLALPGKGLATPERHIPGHQDAPISCQRSCQIELCTLWYIPGLAKSVDSIFIEILNDLSILLTLYPILFCKQTAVLTMAFSAVIFICL